MKRILTVLAVALVMAALVVATVMPAFGTPRVATNGGGQHPPGQATFPCNDSPNHSPNGGGIACEKP
jgi:hypothetical protein